MKTITSFFILVFIIFYLASCENLNDSGNIEFKNSVFFNLTTGNSNQEIYIYDTFPLNYSFDEPPPYINYDKLITENAEIIIRDKNISYNNFCLEDNSEHFPHRYYTNCNQLIIKPNQKYSIEVKSNGQNITGNIITVDTFQILDVKKEINTNVSYYNYNILWSKCNNARFYKLDFIYFYEDTITTLEGNRELSIISRKKVYILDSDTLSNMKHINKIVSINYNPDSIKVTIGAYDLNTYKFFFESLSRVNIMNAYGYLGSSTIKSVKKIFNN